MCNQTRVLRCLVHLAAGTVSLFRRSCSTLRFRNLIIAQVYNGPVYSFLSMSIPRVLAVSLPTHMLTVQQSLRQHPPRLSQFLRYVKYLSLDISMLIINIVRQGKPTLTLNSIRSGRIRLPRVLSTDL